jgi:Mor family transcriptional regulator
MDRWDVSRQEFRKEAEGAMDRHRALFTSPRKKENALTYRNAKEILPPRLLRELARYAGGEMIYVPREGAAKARWGERSGAREAYGARNLEIVRKYRAGSGIEELAESFHLSDHTIRRIVRGSGRVIR